MNGRRLTAYTSLKKRRANGFKGSIGHYRSYLRRSGALSALIPKF